MRDKFHLIDNKRIYYNTNNNNKNAIAKQGMISIS